MKPYSWWFHARITNISRLSSMCASLHAQSSFFYSYFDAQHAFILMVRICTDLYMGIKSFIWALKVFTS